MHSQLAYTSLALLYTLLPSITGLPIGSIRREHPGSIPVKLSTPFETAFFVYVKHLALISLHISLISRGTGYQNFLRLYSFRSRASNLTGTDHRILYHHSHAHILFSRRNTCHSFHPRLDSWCTICQNDGKYDVAGPGKPMGEGIERCKFPVGSSPAR